jgi:hypothetical protein
MTSGNSEVAEVKRPEVSNNQSGANLTLGVGKTIYYED